MIFKLIRILNVLNLCNIIYNIFKCFALSLTVLVVRCWCQLVPPASINDEDEYEDGDVDENGN